MSTVEMKATQVVVDLNDADLELLRNGAKKAWPDGATMSDPEIVLGLAKIAANCMNKPKKTATP
jgi:hypothetical protein